MNKILIIFFILISFISEGQIKIHDLPLVPNKDSTEFIVSKIVSSSWHSYRMPIDSFNCYQLTVHDDSVVRWCTCDTCIDMILKGGSQLIAECAKGMDTAYRIDDSTLRFCKQDVCWDVSLGSGGSADSNFANNDLTNWVGGDRYHNFRGNGLTIDSTSRIHLFVDPAFGGPMKSDVDISNGYMDYQLYQPGTSQYEDIYFWPGDIYSFVEDENNNWTQIDESAKGIGLQSHDGFSYVSAKLYWSAPGVDSTADAYNFAWFDHDTLKKTTGVIQQKVTQSEDIYHENVEWPTSTNVGNIDPASPTLPCSGSVSIEGTTVGEGDYIAFTPVSMPTLADYNYLVFKISSKGHWNPGQRLRLRWLNGSTPIGVGVYFSDGSYGFKSSLTDSCQLIYVPMAAFGDISTATSFRIVGSINSSGTIGYFIDDIIIIQSNINPIIGAAVTWDQTMRNSPDISQDYFSHFNSSTWTIDSAKRLNFNVIDWLQVTGDVENGRETIFRGYVNDNPTTFYYIGNATHVNGQFSPLDGGYLSAYHGPTGVGVKSTRAVISPLNDFDGADAFISIAVAVSGDTTSDNPLNPPLLKAYHKDALEVGGVTPGGLDEEYFRILHTGQIRITQYKDSTYAPIGTVTPLGYDALGYIVAAGSSSGGGDSNDRFGLEDVLAGENRTFDANIHDFRIEKGTDFTNYFSMTNNFDSWKVSSDGGDAYVSISTYATDEGSNISGVYADGYLTGFHQAFVQAVGTGDVQIKTGSSSSSSKLTLLSYGLGNKTGTPTFDLQEDEFGNIIETAISGGGGSADRFGKEDILAAENRTFDLDSHDFMLRDLNYTGGNGIRNRMRSSTFQNTWGGVDGNFFVDVADYPNFDYENYLEIVGGSSGHLNFFSASPIDGEGNGFWIDKDSVQFHRRGTGSPELIFKLVNLPAGDGSESAIGVMADGKVVKTTGGGGGGTPDLQAVTDVGAITTNVIGLKNTNLSFINADNSQGSTLFNNIYGLSYAAVLPANAGTLAISVNGVLANAFGNIDLTGVAGVGTGNFANNDLTADADRTHDFAQHYLHINNLSSAQINATNPDGNFSGLALQTNKAAASLAVQDFSTNASIGMNVRTTTGGTIPAQILMTVEDESSNQSFFRIEGNHHFNFVSLSSFASNAAAITGGLEVGDIYRNGDAVQIVH